MALAKQVEGGLSPLHPNDFEILVDLVFRNAGWRRVSSVGGAMKFVDMELDWIQSQAIGIKFKSSRMRQ